MTGVDCVNSSDLPSHPRKLRDRRAELPESLRTIRTHSGVLVFDVTIGVSGDVGDVRLARPVDTNEPWSALVQAWRSAILDWQFEPTIVKGTPVSVCTTVSITIDVS